MGKRTLTEVVSQAGCVARGVSAEELSDWYRIYFASWLFELEREADLDRKQKLAVLNAAFAKLFHTMPALLSHERAACRDPIERPRAATKRRARCTGNSRRRAAFIKPT
jgi:hypothetical protein